MSFFCKLLKEYVFFIYPKYAEKLTWHLPFIFLQSGNGGNILLNASLGSVEYIASLCRSDVESDEIKNAVRTSAYGCDFVQAALSINKKVNPPELCNSTYCSCSFSGMLESDPFLNFSQIGNNKACTSRKLLN